MKNVISISRRTDIPKWHTSWLINALRENKATYIHPARGISSVSLQPEEVHSLVLWSKDYDNLLAEKELLKYLNAYNIYLHFTITGLGTTFWEPRTIHSSHALKQMAKLIEIFGTERVNWRFDPIVFWQENGSLKSNAETFKQLCRCIGELGVKTCTFSFAQWYSKCMRRAAKHSINYVDPPVIVKKQMLAVIAEIASSNGIKLSCCAQKEWVGELGIKKARCIDGEFLTILAGGRAASIEKDRSQRSQCGCTRSIDIGSYSQRCLHGCIYCYANPII